MNAPSLQAAPRTVATVSARAQANAIAFAGLLVHNIADLTSDLGRLAAENPALIVRVRSRCAACGAVRRRGQCDCLGASMAVVAEHAQDCTLRQSLYREATSDDERTVINALNSRGLLDEEARHTLALGGLSGARLAVAISGLRSHGSDALATSTTAEFLMSQLAEMNLDSVTNARIARLLGELSELLVAGDSSALCAALDCAVPDLDELRAIMRRRLRISLDLDDSSALILEQAVDTGHSGQPDVAFVAFEGKVVARVTERDSITVTIDPAWKAALDASHSWDRDRAIVSQQYFEAQRVVRAVAARGKVVQRVCDHLAEHHNGTWQSYAHIAIPLTRRNVASALGLHESTISRVVKGKTARLPNGAVVSLHSLFDGRRPSICAIEEELRANPDLSDQRIANRLAERGICVARRTVTKYRHRLATTD